MAMGIKKEEFLACCGSIQFAKEMAKLSPFDSLDHCVSLAKDIWFNKVDVNGWLHAFSAHPPIGDSPPSSDHSTSAQWSKGEQSTAIATATSSSLQDLLDWNVRYWKKFGIVFLICASGRSTDEILAELKKRYQNRPIVEFEIAAQEQMKITELRIAKFLSVKGKATSENKQSSSFTMKNAEALEDRVNIIGGHLTAASEASVTKPSQNPSRTRPPITTHVLDVSKGSPAAEVEVCLEAWDGIATQFRSSFGKTGIVDRWSVLGSSVTDKDGRSGQLMGMVDALNPGIYRVSFNTGNYCPDVFFPYVSIAFEVRESQKLEHFHVPLLLSPFSFTTYRGS